jgi:16S rRNA (cytosine1402-N4)-methyltransferase
MDISPSIHVHGFPTLREPGWWCLVRWVRAAMDTLAKQVREYFQLGEWPWFGSRGMATLPGERVAFGMRPDDDPENDPEEDDDMEDESAFGEFRHESVMLAEVVAALQPGPGKLMFDGTLGGGGHAGALLEAGVKLVAMDQDPHAIRHSTKHLGQYGDRLCILRGNFRDFPRILAETGVTGFDGMLVDLGVSSHQLDEAARGFSFQKNGPLDLRMDPESGRPAADLINSDGEEEIERILREFGEEPQARRIARAIVQARAKKRIETTAELADIVAAAIGRKGKKHPATLTFQALRIAVNDELAALLQFLEAAPKWLKPGGRLAVISFHSLEDRIVKQAFHHLSTPLIDRPEWPAAKPNPDFCMKLPRRKPLEPTEEETKRNPRARSAKLRVAEKMPYEP